MTQISLKVTYVCNFIFQPVSLLSLSMNQEDKRDPKNWTEEERDRVVGFFQLLLQVDKRQNPDLYRKSKNSHNMIVLDKDGNEVTL